MNDQPVDANGSAPRRLSILFVCTGNAGRSQIAEAYGRRELGGRADVLSAGVAPWAQLHPIAVELLRAEGVSLEGQAPKSVERFNGRTLDVVVTIGEPARRLLPVALRRAAWYRHWDIDDPAEQQAAQVAESFRHASVTIRRRLEVLLAELRLAGWLQP